MNDEQPSLWAMDRSAIEQTLLDGRSPRRVYSERDKWAVQAVLNRPDFEQLSVHGRASAFQQEWQSAPLPGSAAIANPSVRAPLAGIGWAVLLASVGLLLFAFFGYQTAIHTGSELVGSDLLAARDTINIGLLQNQLMLFMLGLVGVIAGVVLLLADVLITAVHSREDGIRNKD